jgi:hypothetical protein
MLKKIPYKTIETIVSRYKLSDEAKSVLVKTQTPQEAIDLLLAAKQYNDVVQLIAHALPVIEAIYWASEALAYRITDWDTEQIHAINSARAWITKPNETLRIRADQLAERVGLECAPAWVAKAVYWSGTGSIISPELPAVMPPTFLYAHATSAAITIAAAVPAWGENEIGYEKFYLKVIEYGIAIANGKTIVANPIQSNPI